MYNMENNKPLIITAIVIGVVLIIVLALVFTRDDSETEAPTEKNTVSENEINGTEENGNDGQQPTSDPEPQSYTKEELEADLSDTGKTDLEKAGHIADYCVVHEIDGDRAENHCVIWSHNSTGFNENFCDDKAVIADDWCGSREAQTRFQAMLEEAGPEEDLFTYFGGVLGENSDPALLALLIKHRAFVFVPQTGLEIFFVK